MHPQSHHRFGTLRLHGNDNVGAFNSSISTWIAFVVLCLLTSFGQAVFAADGDLDPTFSIDGMRQVGFPGSTAFTGYSSVRVATDAQESVFVGAEFHQLGPDSFAIAKLKPNGSNDVLFGTYGLQFVPLPFDIYALFGIFPQPDGTLMLLGAVDTESQSNPVMVRLTASGALDTAFGDGGLLVMSATPWPDAYLSFEAATRQSDGKFLFAGTCHDCSGQDATILLRISASGVPDPTFGNNGWASVVQPAGASFVFVRVDDLGRALLAGGSGTSPNRQALVLRVSPNGALDASFGTAGSGYVQINVLPNSFARAIEIDSNGAIVVALDTSFGDTPQTGLVRLLANGSRDFGYAGGFLDLTLEFGSAINTLQRRSDGRILAAGWIDHTGAYGSIGKDFLIARVLPNGSLDNSFDGNGLRRIALSATKDTAEAMVLSAGKPVIAGISYVDDVTQLGVLRMQSDLIFSNGFE